MNDLQTVEKAEGMNVKYHAWHPEVKNHEYIGKYKDKQIVVLDAKVFEYLTQFGMKWTAYILMLPYEELHAANIEQADYSLKNQCYDKSKLVKLFSSNTAIVERMSYFLKHNKLPVAGTVSFELSPLQHIKIWYLKPFEYHGSTPEP